MIVTLVGGLYIRGWFMVGSWGMRDAGWGGQVRRLFPGGGFCVLRSAGFIGQCFPLFSLCFFRWEVPVFLSSSEPG